MSVAAGGATKKRTIGELSPDSVEENNSAKKAAMESSEIRELFLGFQQTLTDVEKNLEDKIDKLPSKDDFNAFKMEFAAIREENRVLKEKIIELEKGRAEELARIERLENVLRSRNLIIGGLKPETNTRKAAQELCNDILGIQGDAGIEHASQIRRTDKDMMMLVQFNSVNDVNAVLAKTNRLKNTRISVERDLSEAARDRKKILLKVRKIIRTKLITEGDKMKKLKVTADILRIEGTKFYWRNNELMCGKEGATKQLNKIFNYNFDNVHFLNEISFLDSSEKKSSSSVV